MVVEHIEETTLESIEWAVWPDGDACPIEYVTDAMLHGSKSDDYEIVHEVITH